MLTNKHLKTKLSGAAINYDRIVILLHTGVSSIENTASLPGEGSPISAESLLWLWLEILSLKKKKRKRKMNGVLKERLSHIKEDS